MSDEIVAIMQSPVEVRQIMELVKEMFSAGIAFVPMPVLNTEDYMKISAECIDRLEVLKKAAKNG